MKPFLHSQVSVRKFGGREEDYDAIHDFLDSSKESHPDMRHRALYHSSVGCFLVERLFGDWEWEFHGLWWNPFSWSDWRYVKRSWIRNSDGKKVSVRDIAEQHILDDMGFLPTPSHYLNGMPLYDWLGGRKSKRIEFQVNLKD